MKNTILFLFTTLSIVLLLSSFSGCGKDVVEPKSPDPCLGMYEKRSEIYGDLYKGTLIRGCSGSLQPVNPDRYLYRHPCTNPNNSYEISYLRQDTATGQQDLVKYNFCTDEATLLAQNIVGPSDWSSKDWLVFTKSGQLWKIKSNGDSLIQLSQIAANYVEPTWSPDGTKCLYDYQTIIDEQGVIIKTLTQFVFSCSWKDNNTIVFGDFFSSNPIHVKEYDLLNDNITIIHSIPLTGGLVGFLTPTSELMISQKINKDSSNLILYSLISNQSKLITMTQPAYSVNSVKSLGAKRLIYQRILVDTLTHSRCEVNSRSHIAIMNLDGTDERHVLLPE